MASPTLKVSMRARDFAGTFGVNSKAAYVGYYWGVDGALSGYLASPQAFKLSTVKVPGNQQAQSWGVNKSGVTVGDYVDSKGKEHGMMLSAGKVKNIDDSKGHHYHLLWHQRQRRHCRFISTVPAIRMGSNTHPGKFKDIPGPAGVDFQRRLRNQRLRQHLWTLRRVRGAATVSSSPPANTKP